MASLIQVISSGTRAAQPLATTLPNGSLYYVTDEDFIEQVQSAAWELYIDLSGAAGTPGGLNKNVQYNNAGAFGGVANNATATAKYLRQVSSGTPALVQIDGSELVDDSVGPPQLADTAVTPDTYGDATHVGQFTVDAQGRITAAADVAITGGASAAWALVASFVWSTNITEIDFTGLGAYSDLLIIARDITLSVSGVPIWRVSSDNGATFYATNGDYVPVLANGTVGSQPQIAPQQTNATAARTHIFEINQWNLSTIKCYKTLQRIDASAAIPGIITPLFAMDALRMLPLNGGNITGGTITIYGR